MTMTHFQCRMRIKNIKRKVVFIHFECDSIEHLLLLDWTSLRLYFNRWFFVLYKFIIIYGHNHGFTGNSFAIWFCPLVGSKVFYLWYIYTCIGAPVLFGQTVLAACEKNLKSVIDFNLYVLLAMILTSNTESDTHWHVIVHILLSAENVSCTF